MRVEQVRAVAKAIAALTSSDLAFSNHVDDAAHLAKADLVTDMVGEFPELQGTMGKYYALNEGISPEVAEAIEDHYKPRFAGDSLPRNKVGEVVALADKLATLAGMFSIGQLPTGDKDPFALRRQAIGVVRILVERQLSIDISALVAAAAQQFGSSILVPNNPAINDEIAASDRQKRLDTAAKLTTFIFERFAFLLKEQGFSAHEVDAVLSLLPERLSEVPKRLEAVRAFAALPQAQALASANKRIGNILKKANMAETSSEPEEGLFHEPAEIALYSAMRPAIDAAKLDFDKRCYSDSLKHFAQLREAVDAFFETVMVNDVDRKIRNNRLALLATLHREMNKVADLSKLAA